MAKISGQVQENEPPNHAVARLWLTVTIQEQAAFPKSTGFSSRNLRDMKRFYVTYSDEAIWRQAAAKLPPEMNVAKDSIWPQPVAKLPTQTSGMFSLQPAAKLESTAEQEQFLRQLVAEIPWGHHLLILNKLADPAARLYYLRATAKLGWSRRLRTRREGNGETPTARFMPAWGNAPGIVTGNATRAESPFHARTAFNLNSPTGSRMNRAVGARGYCHSNMGRCPMLV